MGAIRRLVEVVLLVDDLQRSIAFYRDVLGLEVFSPPQAPAAFLRIGPEAPGIPQQVVLVPRPGGAQAPDLQRAQRALHHIGLEVAPEDFRGLQDRLRGQGYAPRSGQHPFMPVDAFYVDDPDGNEVEIAAWRG
jgi:glyoxylase I family protein